MKYRELYEKACDMLPRAYAPFSKFKVGAALLSKSGEVFTGCKRRKLFFWSHYMRRKNSLCESYIRRREGIRGHCRRVQRGRSMALRDMQTIYERILR